MSETQEKVWVVVRRNLFFHDFRVMKVYDDRKDARAYAKRYNGGPDKNVKYSVHGVKKG